MKTIKFKARTAKKSATTKSAIIIAMAAATGASMEQVNASYQDAMRDMAQEYGRNHVIADYTWDPFDGILA